MKHELNIWVVGGDQRQARLAQLLSQDGHTVHTYALDLAQDLAGPIPRQTPAQIGLADCVILPLPVSQGDGSLLNTPLSSSDHPLEDILDRLSPGQFLCGGRVEPRVQALAQARGLTIRDYFAREELAVANAVPTALAIGHRKNTKGPTEAISGGPMPARQRSISNIRYTPDWARHIE